jgi:AcrR family transcriptional regulator
MVSTAPKASGTLDRRRRERKAREQAILGAASKLFLTRGIAAATMDDIARACDLAKGTLYLYFASKEEIAFALLLRSTEDLLAVMRDSLDEPAPPTEQIERLALAYYRFFVAQPASFRYMFVIPHESYSGRVADDLVERWGAAGRAALGLVANLIEEGVAQGSLSVADPWSTAVGLWSAVTGIIVIPSQEVRRPFVGEVNVEQLVVETVRSLLRGMRPVQGKDPARSQRRTHAS